jgi:hypothetical protein
VTLTRLHLLSPLAAFRRVRRVVAGPGLVLALLAVGGAGLSWWWLRMHHILRLQNASQKNAFTVGVALDNQPSVYFETRLAPGTAVTLRFRKNAEAGYIFYNVQGEKRTELGRCGYTDKRINAYNIELAPDRPFKCNELSTGGPFPLP